MSTISDELNLDARSLGYKVSGNTSGTRANTTIEQASEPVRENAIKTTGNPLVWWGILVALFIGLMFLGKAVGGVEPFSNIKMSFYNVVIITLCAIVGMSLAKALAVRFGFGGFGQIILSA